MTYISDSSGSLFPLYILGFLIFNSIALLFPAMPPFAAGLGANIAQVGVIIALQLYVTAIFVAPVGVLSDRIGRRLLLVAGILINLISFLLYLFTSSLSMLMIVRVLNGLASAALYPATSAMVVDIATQEKRGQALGWFTTSTQLGTMVGPAIGGFILKNFGFHAVFLTSAAVSFLALLVALTKLRAVRSGGTLTTGNKFTLHWLGDRREIAALLSIMFANAGLASVISFLPLYGVEIEIDIAQVGLIIATIYLGSVLTRALGGWLSDKAGRAPVILAGLFLCATGIFLVSVFTREVPLHIAAFIFGLGMGSALPACGALIADLAPPWLRGLGMGLYATAFHAGQAIGATGLGIVAASAGFKNMYLAAAMSISLGLVAVFILTRKSSQQSTVNSQ